MPTLMPIVQRVLQEDGFPLHQLEGRSVLTTEVVDDSLEWTCFAAVEEKDEQFLFFSSLPIRIPPHRFPAMVEAITRANFGLPLGNFELDLNDGELRFKTSIDVEGSSLDDALVRTLVYANISVTRRYLPALAAIAEGAEPGQAITDIEQAS